MSNNRVLLILIATFLMCSCSTWRDFRMQKDLERSRATALAKIDQQRCISEGGTVRGVGMFGTPACVKPFPDAGNICSNKSECQALCKAPIASVIGARSTGTCQWNTHDVYGCYNEIERGIVIAGPCFD